MYSISVVKTQTRMKNANQLNLFYYKIPYNKKRILSEKSIFPWEILIFDETPFFLCSRIKRVMSGKQI